MGLALMYGGLLGVCKAQNHNIYFPYMFNPHGSWGEYGGKWSPRQESNLYLPLRRRPFYPLNYGEIKEPGIMP